MDDPIALGPLTFVITALDYGGAEAQVVALAKRLRIRNWQVNVVSLLEPAAFTDDLHNLGVKVQTLNMTRGVADPRAVFRLAKTLRESHTQIVHSHMVHSNILARLTRLLSPLAYLVSTVHSIVEGGRAWELAYRITDPMCDLTTNVSNAGVERYNRVGATVLHKSLFVPNGVDLSSFCRNDVQREVSRSELGVRGRFVWLAVGRFDEAKDYPNMLRGFAEAGGESILLIAGQGEQRKDFESLALQLGLSQRVRFLGLRADVKELMSAADAFLLSSAWEGMPLVLLEAAASSLPAVATNVGGVGQIVDESNGLLVPAQDHMALARAITETQQLPEEARHEMGKAARRKVLAGFDIERIVDTWEGVYLRGLYASKGQRRRFASTNASARGGKGRENQ